MSASIVELPRRVYSGYGFSTRSVSAFATPQSGGDVAALFRQAEEEGVRVALRGSGRSYGDAAMNGGELVLDMTQMNRILASPEIKEVFLREGAEPATMTPAQFARTIRDEIEGWKKVAKAADIKPE